MIISINKAIYRSDNMRSNSQFVRLQYLLLTSMCLVRMQYNPDRYHRQSIRLQGYDYLRSGADFITICTYHREYLFGDIVNGTMELNTFGDIARSHWQQLAQYHPNIIVDESIVMPNHLHGIIVLESSILHGRGYANDSMKSISEIIRGFKTFSAKAINKERGLRGVPVWQRNYYDRIIRNELELVGVAYRR